MFADCFGDGSAFGLEIVYVQEDAPLGTGGAIRNAARALRGGPGSPVLVLNGDVLSGHDLAAQLDLHSKAEAAVTLHLVEVADPARFGCVPTDSGGRVTAFLEKTANPVTNRINAGCYVFRRDVIGQIPAGRGDLGGAGDVPRPDRRRGGGDGLPRTARTGSTWARPTRSSGDRVISCWAGSPHPPSPPSAACPVRCSCSTERGWTRVRAWAAAPWSERAR